MHAVTPRFLIKFMRVLSHSSSVVHWPGSLDTTPTSTPKLVPYRHLESCSIRMPVLSSNIRIPASVSPLSTRTCGILNEIGSSRVNMPPEHPETVDSLFVPSVSPVPTPTRALVIVPLNVTLHLIGLPPSGVTVSGPCIDIASAGENPTLDAAADAAASASVSSVRSASERAVPSICHPP